MAIHYAEGRYVCEVTAQAMGETSKGNPQFVLQVKVLGTPDPKDPESYIPAAQQYTRTHYRAITEKTIEYFTADLKQLGFRGESFRQLDPNTPNFHDFRGQVIDMICTHENDQNGQPRERWGIARSIAGELQVKALEPKRLRELDNLFGKHLKGLKENGAPAGPIPPPVPPGPVAPAPGIDDDDVPF